MNWNYEEKLTEYIAQAQRDAGIGSEFKFEVCTEQAFVKIKTLTPDTIYVVIKYLSSTNTLNAVTQPIQILVSCEQNQIQVSQIVFSKLVEKHNFEAIISNGTYVKQDYREPVVLSNFNEVAYGYRTIMYISATLFIMENVIDIQNFRIGLDAEFAELEGEQLLDRDDCFSQGNQYEDRNSLKYVVRVQEVFAKMRLESMEPIGQHVSGWNEGETEEDERGLILVQGIQCASYEFVVDGTCVLRDTSGTMIDVLNFSNLDYIVIQFLPAPTDTINEYLYNGEEFTQIFPDIVTEYVLHDPISESVRPLTCSIAYSMTPNTQPIPPQKIATSVKSVSTFALTFSVPLISTYEFIEKISEIMNGDKSGNDNFYISFNLGSVSFSVTMKLTSAQITTAIDQVPGLQIGLLK